MEYRKILNEKDALSFISETNGLHDGYIISLSYRHDGYTWGNPMYVDSNKSVLELRVMVTSIWNTLVELVFEGIQQFQIRENTNEIPDSSIAFTQEGFVIWCGDNSTEADAMQDSNYVIAKKMKWRTI